MSEIIAGPSDLQLFKCFHRPGMMRLVRVHQSDQYICVDKRRHLSLVIRMSSSAVMLAFIPSAINLLIADSACFFTKSSELKLSSSSISISSKPTCFASIAQITRYTLYDSWIGRMQGSNRARIVSIIKTDEANGMSLHNSFSAKALEATACVIEINYDGERPGPDLHLLGRSAHESYFCQDNVCSMARKRRYRLYDDLEWIDQAPGILRQPTTV